MPPPPARLLLLALVAAGCGGDAPRAEPAAPPVAFATDAVCIVTEADTLRLTVELAETEAQRAHGLMERATLPPDAGMLFTYSQAQPAESGYWMYRTTIPLDIAYLGPGGEIVSIRQMQPCTSPDPRWCESYPAGAPFTGALEVNQGYFASHGVAPGARVVRAGEPACAAPPAG